jgi:hypothetical protein
LRFSDEVRQSRSKASKRLTHVRFGDASAGRHGRAPGACPRLVYSVKLGEYATPCGAMMPGVTSFLVSFIAG